MQVICDVYMPCACTVTAAHNLLLTIITDKYMYLALKIVSRSFTCTQSCAFGLKMATDKDSNDGAN